MNECSSSVLVLPRPLDAADARCDSLSSAPLITGIRSLSASRGAPEPVAPAPAPASVSLAEAEACVVECASELEVEAVEGGDDRLERRESASPVPGEEDAGAGDALELPL